MTPSGEEISLWISPQGNLSFHPYLFRDSAGNLYGYDTEVSPPPVGVSDALFKISSSGEHTLLHAFCQQPDCTDGKFPVGGPILNAKDGNIYGVATLGGQFGNGVVFRLTPGGEYTVLYNFTEGDDGSDPSDKLVQDSSGNMYGTTLSTAFKITTSGVLRSMHNFCTPSACDSGSPAGPVVVDSTGSVFGTTDSGGTKLAGIVYKIAQDGTFTTLFNASLNQIGKNLVMDKAGNLYGVTPGEGTVNAAVFKLTKH